MRQFPPNIVFVNKMSETRVLLPVIRSKWRGLRGLDAPTPVDGPAATPVHGPAVTSRRKCDRLGQAPLNRRAMLAAFAKHTRRLNFRIYYGVALSIIATDLVDLNMFRLLLRCFKYAKNNVPRATRHTHGPRSTPILSLRRRTARRAASGPRVHRAPGRRPPRRRPE